MVIIREEHSETSLSSQLKKKEREKGDGCYWVLRFWVYFFVLIGNFLGGIIILRNLVTDSTDSGLSFKPKDVINNNNSLSGIFSNLRNKKL